MKRFWLCCLLLLLLALPALCQAEGTPVSLNDMIKTDSERIELRFLDSKNNAKTDAYDKKNKDNRLTSYQKA